jgi:hypothetical protein
MQQGFYTVWRQMNMDYSLCEALKYNMQGIKTILIFYDIMCQYWKNFKKRVDASPFLEIRSPFKFLRSIGLFHVHGHQDSCFPRYAPNFIEGAGTVDGERIETLWAPLNLIASSTRHMSTAHRKEILDDHMNSSNWKKLTGMGEFMLSELGA